MPAPDDELQLERSKMSFGEHLEELRRALFKSILVLFVGFLVGLSVGRQIVDYVQTPIRDAMVRFYTRQAIDQERQRLEDMKAAGQPVPENLDQAAEVMANSGLLRHDFLVTPDDLAAAVRQHFPEAAKALPKGGAEQRADAGALDPKRMIPLRLYEPMEEGERTQLKALGIMDPFVAYMKASLLAGAVIASPFIFYFIWQFVAAGLYRRERNYVYLYLPISIGLFWAGAALAFYVAFQFLLDFFFWFFEKMHIDPELRLSEWLSFVLMMPLGFGISFQLPLVMLLLERLGIFTAAAYLSYWRAAIVTISIIAMVLTPSTDPYSMIIMGLPLVGLYFGGVLMCKYMPGGPLRTPHHDQHGGPPAAAGS